MNSAATTLHTAKIGAIDIYIGNPDNPIHAEIRANSIRMWDPDGDTCGDSFQPHPHPAGPNICQTYTQMPHLDDLTAAVARLAAANRRNIIGQHLAPTLTAPPRSTSHRHRHPNLGSLMNHTRSYGHPNGATRDRTYAVERAIETTEVTPDARSERAT